MRALRIGKLQYRCMDVDKKKQVASTPHGQWFLWF